MSDTASPLSPPSPVPPRPEPSVVALLRDAGCVFAEDEARLLASAARTRDELAAMAARRAAGLPLEHVVGWAEFCGLRIAVDRGVFVPRRRTEFLVRLAAALRRPAAATVVVDLCCGSGAVGVALAAALDRSAPHAAGRHATELHAADLDPAAVACARRNVTPAGGRVHQGDLFAPLPTALRGRVDVLAANVPYVPSGSIGFLPPEARDHEARLALDGGPDGLDVLRRVAAEARAWLAPGGALLFETSEGQAPLAADIVAHGGLDPRVETDDDLCATVVTGTHTRVVV